MCHKTTTTRRTRRPRAAPPVRAELRGIAAAVIVVILFNVGLHFGSMPLGQAAGEAAPVALSIYTTETGYPEGFGLVILIVFGFVAGFIVTIIALEPCGLGEAVETLSKGTFTKVDLFVSVAVGVGVGIVLGCMKVLYSLDLFLVLCVGYALALLLTVFTDEGLACVAWDSTG